MPQPGRHSSPEGKHRSREAGGNLHTEEARPAGETPAHLPKVRVLIADDQRIACEVLRRLLRSEENVEIVGTSHTGPETLEAIKQLNPDLVFLDVQMPGLDGFEVLERLPPNRTPMVIFVTANETFEGRANRARADFLLKPCTRDRIQNALRRAVDRRRRSRNDLNF